MLIDLGSHPIVAGEFFSGGQFFAYNVDVPVLGAELVPSFLGNISPSQADVIMTKRMDDYNAAQIEAVINPIEWVNVGYVQDSSGITAYFQYKLPGYSFNPMFWSNWPDKPPVDAPIPLPNVININDTNTY